MNDRGHLQMIVGSFDRLTEQQRGLLEDHFPELQVTLNSAKEDLERGYNGWTNYETWVMHLWLSNDLATSCAAHGVATSAYFSPREHWVPDSITDDARGKRRAADAMKDWLEENMPDLTGGDNQATAWTDLLNASFAEINWREVAEAFLEA